MPKNVAERRSVSRTTGTSKAIPKSKRRPALKTSDWYESAVRTIAIKNEPPLSVPRAQLWSARIEADAD